MMIRMHRTNVIATTTLLTEEMISVCTEKLSGASFGTRQPETPPATKIEMIRSGKDTRSKMKSDSLDTPYVLAIDTSLVKPMILLSKREPTMKMVALSILNKDALLVAID